jgi:hypothetical protein
MPEKLELNGETRVIKRNPRAERESERKSENGKWEMKTANKEEGKTRRRIAKG